GEGHAPEIRVGRKEFDADVLFAVSMPPSRYYAALNGLAGVLVHEHERLIQNKIPFEKKQAAGLAGGGGGGGVREFFALHRFTIDANGHGHDDAGGAAAFSSAAIPVARHGVASSIYESQGNALILIARLFHVMAGGHRRICRYADKRHTASGAQSP